MFNFFRKYKSNRIISQTRDNYNTIAKHFSDTRNEMWPEFDYFEKYLKDGQNILDWGCGNGRYLKMLKNRKIRYFGVDISQGLLNEAQKEFQNEIESGKAHFICLDNNKLKFPYSFFDIVIMIASFHHLPDEETRFLLLKEVYKQMKPEAKLIITVWNLNSDWTKEKLKTSGWEKKGGNDFIVPWKDKDGNIITKRYYHSFLQEELKSLVEKVGFKVLKLDYVKNNNWSDKKGGRNLILIGSKE